MTIVIIVFVFVFLIAFSLLLMLVASTVRRKKKERILTQMAADMGMSYQARDEQNEIARLLDGFGLRARDPKGLARHVMRGKAQGLEVVLFDYFFTYTKGDKQQWNFQTVALIQQATPIGPPLVLEPKAPNDEGTSGTRFEDRYQLLLPQGHKARPMIAQLFADEPGWYVEVKHQKAVLFRYAQSVKPEDLKTFLAEVLQYVRQLNSSSEHLPADR